MPLCNRKCGMKTEQRSCVFNVLSFSRCQEWIFQWFQEGDDTCRIMFINAGWGLLDCSYLLQNLDWILREYRKATFKLLLISPMPIHPWAAEDEKGERCVVHWLWMGIRWTSLPTLPTAPHKYLPIQRSPRMFSYYCLTCRPYGIFHPKPSVWEEIDTWCKGRQDQPSSAGDQIPLLENLN